MTRLKELKANKRRTTSTIINQNLHECMLPDTFLEVDFLHFNTFPFKYGSLILVFNKILPKVTIVYSYMSIAKFLIVRNCLNYLKTTLVGKNVDLSEF